MHGLEYTLSRATTDRCISAQLSQSRNQNKILNNDSAEDEAQKYVKYF